MMVKDANQDFSAVKLFEALNYQAMVAVDYCHKLKPGKSVWLEIFGDVTLGGDTQVEVKFYTNDLTDSHVNLWNTLKNWLSDKFDPSHYKHLILLTTQDFGKQSTLGAWNESSGAEKLKALLAINEDLEARFSKSGGATPSEVLKLQRKVLDSKVRRKLASILGKVKITTSAKNLQELVDDYKTDQLRAIRESSKQRFIDDLLGSMMGSELIASGWKIDHDLFTGWITELTARYMKRSTIFPSIDMQTLTRSVSVQEIQSNPFVQKLIEIDGRDEIKKAAANRLGALKVISEDFSGGLANKADIDAYKDNLRESHVYSRKSELISCRGEACQATLKLKSLKFYYDSHKSAVPQFCAFENTPNVFRDGLFHILADEPGDEDKEEFHWKLW